jgi:hypothetical protein
MMLPGSDVRACETKEGICCLASRRRGLGMEGRIK